MLKTPVAGALLLIGLKLANDLVTLRRDRLVHQWAQPVARATPAGHPTEARR
jgi:hypothetical protein